MVFESDAYDNVPGGACGSGGGDCPAPQYGELWSPVIDASGWDVDGISVKFYQDFRQFGSTYAVGWSTDGGSTWQRKAINFDVATNAGASRVERVFLPGAAGSSQLQFRFEYAANYYYWAIDDVELVETPAHDMSVNPFIAIPNNAQTPISQLEPIRFLADIQNRGAFDQNEVNLNLTIIRDSDSEEVYNEDLNYGTVAADSTAENVPFNGTFMPPAVPGTYTGTYTLTTDSADPDFNLDDNSRSFNFELTENIFSKETGANTGIGINPAIWDDGAPRSFAMGNYYHVVNANDPITGNPFVVNNITFGIDNPEEVIGQSLTIWIYKWIDENTDAVAQESEIQPKGFNIYVVTGDEVSQGEIVYPILDFLDNTEGITLEDNSDYLAMIQYTAPNNTVDLRLAGSTQYDYSAHRFMYRPTTAAEAPGLGVDEPRYTLVFGNPANGDFSSGVEYDMNSFGGNTVPMVRLELTSNVNVKYLSEDNIVKVFPNPTSEMIQLEIGLTDFTKDAIIRISDINGREVRVEKAQNLQNQIFQYDVSNFANGTYFLHLMTENGFKVTKFVVQH